MTLKVSMQFYKIYGMNIFIFILIIKKIQTNKNKNKKKVAFIMKQINL